MDLDLSREQRALEASVRRLAEERIGPGADERDRTEAFPSDLIRELGARGLMGMFVEASLGGAGLDMVSGTVVLEEIARRDASVALTVAAHNSLLVGHIRAAGSEAQKARWLPDLASGRKLGGWALTEPGSGSDASSLATTAEKRGDQWVLNGAKVFITGGGTGETFVVLARTGRSVTAFVVERGARGFTTAPQHGKLGMRGSDTGMLFFEDVVVGPDAQLGAVGRGLMGVVGVLERGRIGMGAIGVGIARACLEESLAAPRSQSRDFALADTATELEAARLLVRRAAALADAGAPLAPAASQCKLFGSECAVRAAHRASALFGEATYTRAHPIERYLRDAKLLEIGEGTSEIQRATIARRLLAR